MLLGKNEIKDFIDDNRNTNIFKYSWDRLKDFFYTFKYVFDYGYSFFTKRYYGGIIKINNYWYYLPNLEYTDEMHYVRTLYDINDVIAKSSLLTVLSEYEVQDICVIVFKENSDEEMDIQNVLMDNANEFFETNRKAIPLTSLVADLSYTFK